MVRQRSWCFGSRRLGAVLRLLKGPAEKLVLRLLKGPAQKLSPLLKGLDAAELVALPGPDAAYELVYEETEPAVTALQKELQGMKLMALHKRAIAEGVPSDAVDDAMETSQPKQEVIALLVAQLSAAGALASEQQQKLREELTGVRLMALHARAITAKISDDQIEDAMESDDPKGGLIELLVAVGSEATDAQRRMLSSSSSSTPR
eukprot:SAG22_NODE_1914_length_3320_cov_3.030418_2_plen_205_part_00